MDNIELKMLGGPNYLDKLLTVKEAADVMRLPAKTVYTLCAARKIRHERHGIRRGRVMIPETAIAEYRQACTIAVEGPTATPAASTRLPKLRNLSWD